MHRFNILKPLGIQRSTALGALLFSGPFFGLLIMAMVIGGQQ